MHGGRRSGLARELREQAIAARRTAAVAHATAVAEPPFDDGLADGVTRRQLLVAGGALAGTLWLGDAASSRAASGRGQRRHQRFDVCGANVPPAGWSRSTSPSSRCAARQKAPTVRQ